MFGPRSTACLSKPALEKTAVGTKCVWFQPKTARKEQAARHHGERFSRPPGGATGSEPTTPDLPRTPAPARARVSPPRCHRRTDAHRTPHTDAPACAALPSLLKLCDEKEEKRGCENHSPGSYGLRSLVNLSLDVGLSERQKQQPICCCTSKCI